MSERESGSFVIGKDGKPVPNPDDEAMAKRMKLKDKEVEPDVKKPADTANKA